MASPPDVFRQLVLNLTNATAPEEARRPAKERDRLEQRLRRGLGLPVTVTVTNNRRTMISTRRQVGHLEVRLHRMFLAADEATLENLVAYLDDGDPRASRAVGGFIRANRDLITKRPRRVAVRTRGEHYDLAAILDEIVARHFSANAVEGVVITWGKRPPRGRRRRSIRLGTYTHERRLIRIHPALDQEFVPGFFVRFVVFHELLHHVIPPRTTRGRTIYHTAEFKRRERAHPDYRRAVDWENENIERLLGSGAV